MSIWIPIVLVVAIAVVIIAIIVNIRLSASRGANPRFSRGHTTYEMASEQSRGFAKEAEPASPTSEDPLRSRIRIFAGIVGGFFGVLLVRLWGMQVLSSSSYAARAEENQTRQVSIRAVRGRILDRNRTVLVDNRSSMALIADKEVVDDTRVVRRISNLLGMPEMAVRRNIQSTNEGAQSQRMIMIDVPESAVAYIVEHPSQFPGVYVEARPVRSYPFGTLACHLLGYVSSISSEELTAFAEDNSNLIEYQLGDTVGKSGVEYQYESILQGVRGVRTVHVDANGDITGVVSEIEAEPGSDVRLTIDATIQEAAERGIEAAMEAGRLQGYEPTGGACVCMNCKTGEILAFASNPTYSPNSFIGGISTEEWEQLVAEEANSPLLDRVINGLYPSASTIKPLTTLAGLENDVTSYDSTYYCSGWWTGLGANSGRWCWDHTGHGLLDLGYGLSISCDTVFYEIGKAMYYSDNPEGLQEMYRRWGLGSTTGIDLAGESYGRVPDAEWKWDWFSYASEADRMWQPGDTVNIAIGQGDILVTPLQMCYVFSGLVNNGVQMWPHVMLDILSKDTQDTLVSSVPHVRSEPAVNYEDLSFVCSSLRGVISQTSAYSFFSDFPVEFMGKSGTGEAGDDENNMHAWFIAAAPADDPEYVCCSLTEHGGWGSSVAIYACREVFAAIYGLDLTDETEITDTSGVEVLD